MRTSARLNTNPMGWLVLASHCATACCGLYGMFVDPSPNIANLLGVVPARFLWSTTLVLFGTAAAVGRYRSDYDLEVGAIIGVGCAFALWSAFVLLGTGWAAGQTAFAFFAVALHSWGWASAIRWWSARERQRLEQVQQALATVHDDHPRPPS